MKDSAIMVPDKLIIFDYSGTLSLESTSFAMPDRLVKHLTESGLVNLGISSPEIFWEQIVNPTWLEGSRTTAGYKKVIEERMRAICYENKSIVSRDKISEAASSFVDSYLSHSRIDRRWQPILIKLGRHPSTRVIIATDHYAEATGYIIKFLKEFQIQAIAAKDAFAAPGRASIIVANSADLGVHKDKSRFWAILKAALNISAIRHILLIDDFGSNEQKGDSYGTGEKVERRKRDTIKLLRDVFSAEVQVVPFMIDGKKREKAFGALIKQTSLILDHYLSATNDG